MRLGLGLALQRRARRGEATPPPPIAPVATLEELLPSAAHRAQRQSMIDAHFPAISAEQDFTGFTDVSGFTIQTAVDADDLAAKLTAQTAAQSLIIECDWDGVSITGNRVFGVSFNDLVVNGSVDWGYDRPTSNTLVRPAAGRSPQISGTWAGNEFYLVGLNRIEFLNMGFTDTSVRFEATANYPSLVIVAVNDGRSTGNLVTAFRLNACRLFHAVGNTFDGMQAGITGKPNYMRSFNNVVVDHGENDFVGMRDYSLSYQAGWDANIWVAGTVFYDTSGRALTSGLHPDFAQISHNNDDHVRYRVLLEGNAAHINRPGANSGAQGVFGDDGGDIGDGYGAEWLVHNNIIVMGAYWACLPWDPNDNETKVVHANMFARTAELADGATVQDTYPRVQGLRLVAGSGTLEVSRNYAGRFLEGRVNGETFTDNVVLDPRLTAVAGTAYADVITGPVGGYVADANGYQTYVSPDAGAASPAAAKAAIAAMFKPLAGWGVDAGPVDPATWPTDWANLTSPVVPGVLSIVEAAPVDAIGTSAASIDELFTAAAGTNRRVIVFAQYFDSDRVTEGLALTWGGVAMNLIGTVNSAASNPFEGLALFELAEAAFPPGATGVFALAEDAGEASNTALRAMTLQGVGAAPAVVETTFGSPYSDSITPSADGSLVIAAMYYSASASGAAWATGVADFGGPIIPKGTLLLGQADQDASPLTVRPDLTGARGAQIVASWEPAV